jgi:alkyl hydroperoxide reductase subunit AhpF
MNRPDFSNHVLLEVYVAAHCWQCHEARGLAEDMAHVFPVLHTRVVDLDQPGTLHPPGVFAVPTFLLNGKIVSLGTPFREELTRKIRSAFQRKEQGFGEPRENRLSAEE